MGVLTESVVLQKTKVDSLYNVKNLNMWGSDISDVSILQRMPNVEVLSLSVNRISTLRDFAYCTKITELYLRKNEIDDLSEVQYLQGLKNLKILWLCDNPCAESEEYRPYVIKLLPNLVKLDNTDITPEERAAAMQRICGPTFTRPQSADIRNNNYDLKDRERQNRAAKAVGIHRSKDEVNGPTAGAPPSEAPVSRSKWDAPTTHPLHVLAEQSADSSGVIPSVDGLKRPSAERRSHISPPQQKHYHHHHHANNTTATNNNVLNAVMCLLNELDMESLQLVRSEVDRRLRK